MPHSVSPLVVRDGLRGAVCLALIGGAWAAPAMAQARMPAADRLDCERRVQEVYWRHRVWPKENPGA